jgi:Zn-dependent metalloprotease
MFVYSRVLTNRLQLGRTRVGIMSSTFRSQLHGYSNPHLCSIIPGYLLKRIVDNNDAHPDARKAAEMTLAHTGRLRATRVSVSTDQTAPPIARPPMQSIIPPHMFQAIIDSNTASDADKDRARKNLEQSQAIRSARESAAPTAGAAHEHLNRKIYDAGKRSILPGTLIRKEGDPAIQDVNGDVVYDDFKDTLDFYAQVFKRDSIDNRGMIVIGSIHYDDDQHPAGFDNAFWNGEQMIFGDGDGVMFGSFTKSLDVIGHELTHGVTQNTANLPFHQQSGALNESISDVFGSMVKQYHLNQTADEADWLIGKELLTPEILAQGNRALRDMRAPGTAFKNTPFGDDPQPGNMSDYVNMPDDDDDTNDHGGVHINSGIPNRAFFLVATALGGHSWERAGPIWYASLLDQTLNDFANAGDGDNFNNCFPFFAELTCTHALALFGSDVQAVVRKAWTDVGVLS